METIELSPELLKRLLQKAGVPEDRYSLKAGAFGGTHAIARRNGNQWVVYFNGDRGEEVNNRVFYNKRQACDELIKRLLGEGD